MAGPVSQLGISRLRQSVMAQAMQKMATIASCV